MQFIWMWIEDFIGKGLDWTIILKLLYYAGASLVPMALPLAVLLASVMTFGNLGEHFELTAMKSAGISLWRIMSPLIIFMILTSTGAFFFSNNVLPYTTLKYARILYDVSRKRPELNIKTGVFNNDIDGFSIKIDDKNMNTGMMYGFMIYDHTKQKGNKEVTLADSGELRITNDQKNMVVTLYHGSNFSDMKSKSGKEEYPFRKDAFKKQIIIFELPDLSMKVSDDNLFKKHYEILNTHQLGIVIDSLQEEFDTRLVGYQNKLLEYNYFKFEKKSYIPKDSVKRKKDSLQKFLPPEKLEVHHDIDEIYDKLKTKDKLKVVQEALNSANRLKTNIENNKQALKNREEWLWKHQLARNKKFTLSFACLVFFFIGAPLGSIIRKGGFGLPILVSVVFFMFYYVLFIMGEKAAGEGALPVFIGAWMASGILFPMGVFITYKATRDSKIVSTDKLKIFFSYVGKILRFKFR
jgi:lipopolysaccharide export system permease protein